MTAQLIPALVYREFTNGGSPLAFGLVYTYAAGTTTPQGTYVDSTQTTQNPNPVVLNARGEASIWLNPALSYKFVVTDSNGNTIRTVDNVQGLTVSILALITQSFIGQILYPQTAAELAASVTPLNYYLPPGNVLRYGNNTTPGTTNMSAAFQAAVSSNEEVYIPDGNYLCFSTINLQANSVIIGANRGTVTVGCSAAAPLFQYLSPQTATVINTGMRFENFTINAFNAIQLNQQGNTAHYGSLASYPTDVFNTQCYIVGPVFRHMTFNGLYLTAGDTNIDTNLWPTSDTTSLPSQYANPADLISYSTGIFAVKCFDMYIEQSCLFYNCGIGVMLDGSDVNNIGGRFITNARHVHILSHDSFGFSNRICGRDMLSNRRMGAIFVDSANATVIDSNFFEGTLGLNPNNSSASGCFVATQFDTNTHITNNRFEPNRVGAPSGTAEVDLSPEFGAVFANNTADPPGTLPGMQVQVRSTNYYNPSNSVGVTGTNSFFMKFSGNAATIPPPVWISAEGLSYPVCPHVELDYNNVRLFNAQNPKNLSGSGSATFPWKISSSTSRCCINTSNVPLYITFYSTPDDLDILLRFIGTYVSGAGTIAVTWGGSTVWSATIGYGSGSLTIQDITIRRPDAKQGIQPIVVELADGTVEWESVQLIPVNFQQYSAAPTGSGPPYSSGNTWRVGDKVYNTGVTSSTNPGWVCTTAGAGGTAVFTAMPNL